ncbi:MAG: 16S rRNA (uracil(1498)-N(3))-methyltransferase [Proteobacteria bacterium]|nr:16S rRNA (uracil(1498)-N(3))-methyltransferase [Pseudomonadota bacterium]
MSYFIFEDVININQQFTLAGEEARHLLSSRRIQLGELIEIQDKDFRRFHASVESISKRDLELLPFKELETVPESPLKINLFQALIKEKNLELILQKTTELGISNINLFPSAFSQRLKKDPQKQLQRWKKICVEACKQSGRTKPPELSYLESFDKLTDLLASLPGDIPTLIFDTGNHITHLGDIKIPTGKINLLIGPEGGWQRGEIEIETMLPINLGSRILRAETAAISAVTLLQFLHGDLQPST